jgi:hypothetical protein
MQTCCQRYAVLASVALVLGLAACSSSSTGPTPITPQQLAEHFDSIYAADLAAGTHADTIAATYVAGYVEVAPAFGGTEATFTSSSTSWMGVGFIYTEEGESDTVYLSVLYPNRNLQTAVLTAFEMSNGTVEDSVALGTTNGFQSTVEDSTLSGSASLASVGNACTEQSGLVAGAALTYFVGSGSACVVAKWTESFVVVFQGAAGINPVGGSNVGFTGPFFTNDDGSRIVAIPSKGAAAALNVLKRLHHAR